MTDKAACPKCGQTFVVSRYGRKIPCPKCDELLDIMPDDPVGYDLSDEDWERVIRARIAYLTESMAELMEIPGTQTIIKRTKEEIARCVAAIGAARREKK